MFGLLVNRLGAPGAGSSVSAGSVDASFLTWDSYNDTYDSFIFQEAASYVTWDSSSDTYTQSIFYFTSSSLTWDSGTDTYTQEIYNA